MASRPVHSAFVPLFPATGVELSCWAYVSSPRPSVVDSSYQEKPLDDDNDQRTDDTNKDSSSQVEDLSDERKIGVKKEDIEDIFVNKFSSSDDNNNNNKLTYPNLITAQGSTINIYEFSPSSKSHLKHLHCYDLSGIVCSLDVLQNARRCSSSSSLFDGLLIGFAGQPRLSVVYPLTNITNYYSKLQASSIIDLTPKLSELCRGATSPLEQDLICSVHPSGKIAAVVLGGGISVAVFSLDRAGMPKNMLSIDEDDTPLKVSGQENDWWLCASEPYFIDLHSLSRSLSLYQQSPSLNNKITHPSSGNKGFKDNKTNFNTSGVGSGGINDDSKSLCSTWGEIVSLCFLPSYSSPTLAILHTTSTQIWAGRITKSSAKKYGCNVTAFSVDVEQYRSVVIWSTLGFDSSASKDGGICPCDARFIKPLPPQSSSSSSTTTNTELGGCCVISPNGIVYIPNGGGSAGSSSFVDALACNGFSNSTMPSVTNEKGNSLLHGNPKPLPHLNIQLDGCRFEFVSPNLALLASRGGRMYSVEIHNNNISRNGREDSTTLSCAPLNYKFEHGATSTLAILPMSSLNFGGVGRGFGIVFCGSCFGDSVLLGYHHFEHQFAITSNNNTTTNKRSRATFEENSDTIMNDAKVKAEERPISKVKVDPDDTTSNPAIPNTTSSNSSNNCDEDEESIMRKEEEELYEGYTMVTESPLYSSSSITSGSDDEDEFYDKEGNLYDINKLLEQEALKQSKEIADQENNRTQVTKRFHRPTISALTYYDIKPLHTLCAPGPLGRTCVSPPLSGMRGEKVMMMPCGYGPSGGIAVLHSIVQDMSKSTVELEEDIRGVENGWICPKSNLLFFSMDQDFENRRHLVMQLNKTNGRHSLDEIDFNYYCSKPEILGSYDLSLIERIKSNSKIIAIKEYIILGTPYLISVMENIESHSHHVVISKPNIEAKSENILDVILFYNLKGEKDDVLISLSPLEQSMQTQKIHFICSWSSGKVVLVTIFCDEASSFQLVETPISAGDQLNNEKDPITATDIFTANPYDKFSSSIREIDSTQMMEGVMQAQNSSTPPVKTSSRDHQTSMTGDDIAFDLDDLELYGLPTSNLMAQNTKSNNVSVAPSNKDSPATKSDIHITYLAVCRESGLMQIYSISPDEDLCLEFEVEGCGYGIHKLPATKGQLELPEDLVKVIELRFFYCGDFCEEYDKISEQQSLCCAMMNSSQDLHVYTVKTEPEKCTKFTRIPLSSSMITRPSQEEKKYESKLLRKGLLKPPSLVNNVGTFRKNQLLKFGNISGQTGLFVSTSRPLWILSCDGYPVGLKHFMRHVAASLGGGNLPISMFTENSGASCLPDDGFITIHRRIGRIGSQRLTVYRGLSQFSPEGSSTFCPFDNGSGMVLTKIPLGVTVRHMELVKDLAFVSSQDSENQSPVFALLISRELEIEQPHLFDDGLTQEERDYIKQEKEREKTRRQVEADLGGFDVETEWVEEIEREDIFDIHNDLGGAPKMHIQKHEVWLVTGKQNLDYSFEWEILDTFELNEFEHGMALKVMKLTENVDDSSGANSAAPENTDSSTLFVTVGTGIVDQDGEDISSKGRILLFEIRNKVLENEPGSEPRLTLSLNYEKNILIGPVTSLNCLACDDKSRLVVGAGAEVTVEQWGSGKLTQVGFFHANMQVSLDIHVSIIIYCFLFS